MYCSKCGYQLDDDSAFCPNCGTPCAAEIPEPVAAGGKTEQKPAQETPLPKAPSVPGGPVKNAYYAAEFAKIAAGQKPKFNWAAFFLGPYHQLYHGSTQLFKKTFLPYLITMAVLFVAGQVASFMLLSSFGMASLVLTLLSGALYMAACVWGLVLLISNGRKYNRKLYEQVQGRADKIPARLKPALLLLVGYTAALLAVSVLLSAVGSKMVLHAWTEDLDPDSSAFYEGQDVPAPVTDDGADFLQLTDGVFVSADCPWEGAWITEDGYTLTSWYFISNGDTPTQNADGSYSLTVYDTTRTEVTGEIHVSADCMSLTRTDPDGNQEHFVRPTLASAENPLPAAYWGAYSEAEPLNGEPIVYVVDAFCYSNWLYRDISPADGGGYTLEYATFFHTFLAELRLEGEDVLYEDGVAYKKIWSPEVSISDTADEQPAAEAFSLDLSLLPDIPFEDTDLYSTCFWTDQISEGGFDGATLMGDSSVTIGTLFSEAFDSYSWDDSYMVQQGTQATVYDAVCQKDGGEIRLRFSKLYTSDIPIREGTIFQPDGTMQSLSQYDIACLLSALSSEYHQKHGTQPHSLARDLRGSWISTDGRTELTIDGSTYGGDSYKIGALSESTGELFVTITRGDGTQDERWIELTGDSMKVYNVVPMSMRDKGDLIATFNRSA